MTELTIALIHGGSYNAGFWDLLRPELTTPSRALNLPGRADRPADLSKVTLDDAVRSVTDDLADLDEIVLVAHSSGGLVVPGAVANLRPRVRHVILNAASVPPEGGLGLDCMHPKHRDVVASLKPLIDAGRYIVTPNDPPEPARLRKGYGGTELTGAEVGFMSDPARFVNDTYNFYFSPVSWAAVTEVPVTYIINLSDRAVPRDLQYEMIGRLPMTPRVIPLDCGHIPMVTAPTVFAALLDGIAQQILLAS